MAAAWAEWITKKNLSLTDKLNKDWLRPVLFSCETGEYSPGVRAIHHRWFSCKTLLERSFTRLGEMASGFLLFARVIKTPDFLFVSVREFRSSEPQALALK
jgi:hypothetical protein